MDINDNDADTIKAIVRAQRDLRRLSLFATCISVASALFVIRDSWVRREYIETGTIGVGTVLANEVRVESLKAREAFVIEASAGSLLTRAIGVQDDIHQTMGKNLHGASKMFIGNKDGARIEFVVNESEIFNRFITADGRTVVDIHWDGIGGGRVITEPRGGPGAEKGAGGTKSDKNARNK